MTYDRGRVEQEIRGEKSSEEGGGGGLNDCKCNLNFKIQDTR